MPDRAVVVLLSSVALADDLTLVVDVRCSRLAASKSSEVVAGRVVDAVAVRLHVSTVRSLVNAHKMAGMDGCGRAPDGC